ncbi:MAG: rhomboid family intramembrane serine protease [Desulfobulbaceae bacterium]|nr:rhomboid family intramembrane serine protease [Desulfobulbaceae bacterium]HIJ77899.1 rhomboid family intramembrane serine protease [Deltaproteobacteria bacterium]
MATLDRNSQLCPNCRKLISRDEPHCPYCKLKAPGSWWKNNLMIGNLHDPDQVIKLIIGVNIVMFILTLLLNPRGTQMAIDPFSFLSPDNRSLLLIGATGTIPIDSLGRWWSLISANFLHGSLLHIIFNMIALRQIAPLVIAEYGMPRMFTIYLVGGMGGFLLSYLAGVRFTIGASASVCALIGAALYYGKSRGGHYGEMIFKQIGGWAIGLFVFGMLVPGINNWGHGGGMAAGALIGLLMGYKERSREKLNHKIIGAICVAASAITLVLATGTAFYYRFF